jgi:serine protease Do
MRFVVIIALLYGMVPVSFSHPAPEGEADEQTATYLGVGVGKVSEELAAELKLDADRGAWVQLVADDSPAQKAGLRRNDILIEFDGDEIESPGELGDLVRDAQPGHRARLKILRDGKVMTLKVTLGERSLPAHDSSMRFEISSPEFLVPDLPSPALRWHNNPLGIDYENVDSQIAEYFGVKQGLLVRYVQQSSVAAKAGLKAGDVIVKIDDKEIAGARQGSSVWRSDMPRPRSILLEIVRDRKPRTIKVELNQVQGQAYRR